MFFIIRIGICLICHLSANQFVNSSNGGRYKPTQPISGSSRVIALSDKIKHLVASGAVVMVDGDNVRGKTKFSLTKEHLCDAVIMWAKQQSIQDRVVIFFDHADEHEAFLLNGGSAIVFSGPKRSADDIISRDVSWFHQTLQRNVVVITEDQELRSRCRKSSTSTCSVSIIASPAFVEILTDMASKNSEVDATLTVSTPNQHILVEPTGDELKDLVMQANLIQVEHQLQQKITTVKSQIKRSSRKKLTPLKAKLLSLQTQVDKIAQTSKLVQEELINNDNSTQTAINPIESEDSFQSRATEILLKLLTKNKVWEPEQTWERIILAENFRRNLQLMKNNNTSSMNFVNTSIDIPILFKYVNEVNLDLIPQPSKLLRARMLRPLLLPPYVPDPATPLWCRHPAFYCLFTLILLIVMVLPPMPSQNFDSPYIPLFRFQTELESPKFLQYQLSSNGMETSLYRELETQSYYKFYQLIR
eukprot:gene6063-12227_t